MSFEYRNGFGRPSYLLRQFGEDGGDEKDIDFTLRMASELNNRFTVSSDVLLKLASMFEEQEED